MPVKIGVVPRMRLLTYLFGELDKYSIPFTLMAVGLLILNGKEKKLSLPAAVLTNYCVISLSIGFVFSVLLFRYFKRNEIYLFYNLGFRPWTLVVLMYILKAAECSGLFVLWYFLRIAYAVLIP